jgi:flagellar hook-length control protein FliK
MTAAPLRAGNRGRQTGEAHAPAKGLGVLEQRFAAILRPMEAASSDKGAPSAFAASTIQGDSTPPGAPALPAEALHPGGQTLAAVNEAKPATAPAETVASFPAAIDQGEISLNGEAPQGDMAGADSPDIPTPAAGPAGRTTVSTFTGNVAETAAGKPSVDRPMADSQILDQVIGRLSVDRNAEASRMSIKLQPEELGRIDIDLTVEQGRIKAQVVAQNQQVQDVLERHLPRLRESLEQQGLKLDQIQVSVDAHAGDSRGFSQQHHQRHADGHPRSWTGTHQGGPVVETEAPPPAALHPQGKLSLRI